MGYAKQLGKKYSFKRGRLVFKDNVEYTVKEAAFIATQPLSQVDIRAIHLVKSIFGGELELDNTFTPTHFGKLPKDGGKRMSLLHVGVTSYDARNDHKIEIEIKPMARQAYPEAEQLELDL